MEKFEPSEFIKICEKTNPRFYSNIFYENIVNGAYSYWKERFTTLKVDPQNWNIRFYNENNDIIFEIYPDRCSEYVYYKDKLVLTKHKFISGDSNISNIHTSEDYDLGYNSVTCMYVVDSLRLSVTSIDEGYKELTLDEFNQFIKDKNIEIDY